LFRRNLKFSLRFNAWRAFSRQPRPTTAGKRR